MRGLASDIPGFRGMFCCDAFFHLAVLVVCFYLFYGHYDVLGISAVYADSLPKYSQFIKCFALSRELREECGNMRQNSILNREI